MKLVSVPSGMSVFNEALIIFERYCCHICDALKDDDEHISSIV